MPEEGQNWLARNEVLSDDELLRVIGVAASLGVKKIRVTGGEPLTRSGSVGLVRRITEIPGIQDVGISTNGTLLTKTDPACPNRESYLDGLVAAGISSINVSLDSLDPIAYAASTGRDLLTKALDGIRAARAEGVTVKINSVLMRNQTESDMGPLLDFAHKHGVLLRFIELMPLTDAEVLDDSRFLPAALARRILQLRTGELKPRPDFRTNGPASYFEVPDSGGQLVGFISALSDLHFCDTCDKLRLTCEGKLRPCLGSHLEFDLREQLRAPAGCTDDQIAEFFQNVVDRKPEAHEFRDGYLPGRHMIAIGG